MQGKTIVQLSAVTSQLLLLGYLELVEWVDLFPWNDVRNGNGQEVLDVALGVVIAIAVVATYRAWRLGMVGATIAYAVWTGLQLTTFWLPYLQGATPRWQEIYDTNFAQTIQLLPRTGLHLPPDANHISLQLILAAALSCTAVATWRVLFSDVGSRGV